MRTVPLNFDAPWFLAAGLALALLAAVAVTVRRLAFSRTSLLLGGGGILLVALAAGEPVWLGPTQREVVVMVDLSASTRTAGYRDRALLDRRIAELLGDIPRRTSFFADGNADQSIPGPTLGDLPGERTDFSPPASATAVLLFSDCQFKLPDFAPPTYVVVDPALDHPADAAVARFELRGTEAAVTIANTGPPRELTLTGVTGPPRVTVTEPIVVVRSLAPGASQVIARLSPGDAWPENDVLIAAVPSPMASERWWVGAHAPGSPWRAFDPSDLPTQPAAWLAPSVVVFDNVPAPALSTQQQDRLVQYVRDLGGSVILLGGDHAFAAGGYTGSTLEAISPLASSPPRPTEHWMLLADASGSMNAPASGASGPTRWELTSNAIVQLLPELPADDIVSVGRFSDDLQWWVAARSVRETLAQAGSLPPPGTSPHGATNLEAALIAIAEAAEPAIPKQLLLITDADAELDRPDALAAALAKKNIHLHLLAIEEGKALPALRQIIQATGGTLVLELHPKEWRQAAQELLRGTLPNRLPDEPVTVRFFAELAALPPHSVLPWNRTWLKPDATQLAATTHGGEEVPMAALWQAGSGRAGAFAFEASPGEAQLLADRIAHEPRDPRFSVTWDAGSPLRLTVNAVDAHTVFLNDQAITLELADESNPALSRNSAIPQVAPGRYEAELPAPRSPALATVRAAGRVIDRTALAGRYAPEFDAIGNDLDAMHELASRTGGRVIGPREHGRLDLRWPRRQIALGAWVGALGALLIAAALILWRAGS